MTCSLVLSIFFFNDTPTTEIYTLSLHDTLPIYQGRQQPCPHVAAHGLDNLAQDRGNRRAVLRRHDPEGIDPQRSEEHTSELQSRKYLVCRLLLEKNNNIYMYDVVTQLPYLDFLL